MLAEGVQTTLEEGVPLREVTFWCDGIKMNELARAERFEEATPALDRLRALVEGLARSRANSAEPVEGSAELRRLLVRVHAAERRL